MNSSKQIESIRSFPKQYGNVYYVIRDLKTLGSKISIVFESC
ncbi:MAG: hypothetical protein ACRCX2_36440 [Paraclostridium sp.]